MILNNPSTSKTIAFSAANESDISAAIFSAYKKGFRIVFILSASLAALALFLAVILMPQIDIKHEKKSDSDESQNGSLVLVKEMRSKGSSPHTPQKKFPMS